MIKSNIVFGQAVAYILAFSVVYIGIRDLFSYSDSRAVYAFINAWWAGAYIAYVCGIRFRVAIYSFILTLILLFVLYLSDFYHVLYHDAPESISPIFLLIICIQSLIVTSPIVFSFLVVRGKQYYKNKFK